MTDEFDLQSKIAFHKKRQADEAAQALAVRREQEQAERQARRKQQELMATRATEIPLLVTEFHRWAVRHNVPGERFRPAFRMSKLTGWRIATRTQDHGGNSDRAEYTSYTLLLGEDGNLYETNRYVGSWAGGAGDTTPHRISLEQLIAITNYTIENMTNSIAEIVAKSGKPWPR